MQTFSITKWPRLLLTSLVLAVLTISCVQMESSPKPAPQVDAPESKTNAQHFLGTPIVVMISIDGFRADYLEKYQPPTLLAWAKQGVRAEGLVPSFPTLTFPNHVTLVTGMRPGRHGIVGNAFYDEARQEAYSIGNSKVVNDGSWYRGSPLWTVAERNGMLSAVCFWVGSEAKIGGVDPTYFKPYEDALPNSQRVTWVTEWLSLPEEKRPHMINLYFSTVDTAGHKFGPDAEETKKAILELDLELARLKAFIDSRNQNIQVIVVSDHGMKKINETVDFSSAESLMKMKDSGRGALSFFYSDDEALIEKAYLEAKAIQAQNPGKVLVYKGSELPARWALDDVNRRGDIIIVGEPGVYIGYKRSFENGSITSSNIATHGWDMDKTSELQGLFIANGSMFKQGIRIPAFDNVHVYPLVLEMLKLKPLEVHDGNLAVLKPILVK